MNGRGYQREIKRVEDELRDLRIRHACGLPVELDKVLELADDATRIARALADGKALIEALGG